jgi:hypothetical protein
MTEQDWLQATDPQPMLEFLRSKVSDRKLRLFAIACYRLIRHLLLDDRLLLILEGIEREADGHVTVQDRQLRADWEEERQVLADSWGLLEIDDERRREILGRHHRPQAHNVEAMQALDWLLDWNTVTLLGEQGVEHVDALLAARATAFNVTLAAGDQMLIGKTEAEILRDVFGNPFRPVTSNPAWLRWHDGLLVSMARQMYDSRDFIDMPILADALEDAGCTDADILTHCRQPGEHVRGCWVLDLILGKK